MSLTEIVQLWAGVVAIAVACITIWSKLNVNEHLQDAWNSTFGRTQVQLDTIIRGQSAMTTRLNTRLDALEDGLREVQLELSFDSGGSMKDMARRTLALTNVRMDADDNPLFLADEHGQVYWTNRAYQELSGFSMARAGKDGWINVLHPDHRESIANKWMDSVKHERDFSEDMLCRHPVLSDYDYWIHVEAYRQLDIQDRLQGYYGVVTLIDKPG